MFSMHNQLELRRVTISSLVTCIYLPLIVTVVSYKGLLYSVGQGSSFYILVLIFIAELLKSVYLNSSNDVQGKRRPSKTRVGDIAKSFVFLLGVMFAFFVGVILFGAPALECHEETLMLSCLLTLLTMFPLVAHCGEEAAMQLLFCVRSSGKNAIVEMLVRNAMLTVAGTWLGAVVIPLDWNTPWQVWPIPCYLGAIGGFLLSNVLSVLKVSLVSAAQKYPALNFLVNIMSNYNSISK